ncbi:hypothetical protein JCM8097_006646, partial [Rhodosporidiobolus ruineniae]
MADFSNGFFEEDDPLAAQRGPSPPPPTLTTSTSTRRDVLDLTSESPPPISSYNIPHRRSAHPAPASPTASNSSNSAALDRWLFDGGQQQPPPRPSAAPTAPASTSRSAGQGSIAGGGFGAGQPRMMAQGRTASSSSSAAGGGGGFAAAAGAPVGFGGAARQYTGGAVHQHPLASTSSSSSSAVAGPSSSSSSSFGRIPVISSASAARMPSQMLSVMGGSPYNAGTVSAPGGFTPAGSVYRQQQQAQAGLSSSSSFAAYASAGHSSFAAQQPRAPSSSVSPQKGKAPAPRPPLPSDGAVILDSDDDSPAPVVDLTSDQPDSDDDVIVDETPVCLGAIHINLLVSAPVYPIIPPDPPQKTRADGSEVPEDEFSALQARYQHMAAAWQAAIPPIYFSYDGPTVTNTGTRQHVTVWVDTPGGSRVKFAFVDYDSADVLGPMLGTGWSGRGVGKGGNGAKLWCEAVVLRQNTLNPCILRCKLVLFSRPYDSQQIADALERAVKTPLYLDHPSNPPQPTYSGYVYKNPHNPSAGVGSRAQERRREQLQNGINGMGAYKAVKVVDEQRKQVKDVFAEMKSGIDLEEVTPPPIVSTPLYPHQKQALSFLLDRETPVSIPPRDLKGEPPTIVSLWKRMQDPFGRTTGWKSVVTEMEVKGERPPPQARGAILADDMGLGKTIVVISLVCTTLPDARLWALKAPTSDTHDERFDETISAADRANAGRSDFSSHLWGLGGATTGSDNGGKPLSKKKQAKQRREKLKSEQVAARFARLEVRSRATLIVCPLSTVQNWESQFEEHTRVVVEEDGEGGKVVRVRGEDEEDEEEKPKKRDVKGKGKKRRVVDDDEEDEGSTPVATTSAATTTDDESMKEGMDDSDSGEDVKPKLGGKSAKSSSSSLKKDKKGKKKPALSIYIYHGNARLADPRKLADHDVVITTFSTLGTEYSRQERAEEEREDEEEREQKRKREEDEGIIEVFGFGADGQVLMKPPGAEEEEKPKKRKRKRVEGSGVSPLQAVQWFRVVLDEAHIIKEHKTIQARAACDLSTSRRIALSGTPLQNSLNDIYSLIRFLRLEPFTDRALWTQYIGSLAQKGEDLGADRLKLVMRHIALRRTKDTKGADGKPILSLPPMDSKLISLEFTEPERAFYASHHTRYKHDFAKLDETDSVMKNYCSILQELLKLRQICVHSALLRDSEDRAGGLDLAEHIKRHGISKPRAIQLIALFRDAGVGGCAECAAPLAAFERANVEELVGECEDVKPGAKKPAPKKRRTARQTAATSEGGVKVEDDLAVAGAGTVDCDGSHCFVTRCQHLFCRGCFLKFMAPSWPNVKSDERTVCKVCSEEFSPALEAVEIAADEFQKALQRAGDERPEEVDGKKGKGRVKAEKKGGKATRLFEHSTKTRALLFDLIPFSQTNPASANYDASFDPGSMLAPDGTGGTIGLQPVHGEIVKSVVFSQWTTLLDR